MPRSELLAVAEGSARYLHVGNNTIVAHIVHGSQHPPFLVALPTLSNDPITERAQSRPDRRAPVLGRRDETLDGRYRHRTLDSVCSHRATSHN
jgi:hypothetical protein